MRHRRAAALLLVTLLAAAACSDDGSERGADDGEAPVVRFGDDVEERVEGAERTEGSDVGDVELVGFDDRPVRLADYEGRPLVVNVFASWCAPCVREMPAIERVKQDVGDRVAFLGIATNDRIEDALALVEQTGITWDVARDPHGDAAEALGVVRMPTTFLVSPDGEVVEHHGGTTDEDELRALIEERFGVDAATGAGS